MSTLHAPQRTSAVLAALQHPASTDRPVRQTVLDRLAMRLALALLLWSTRPRADRAEIELRRRARCERDAREQEWERRRALLAPRR
ncbi:hypothetical protein KZX37_11420 [Microbacterium sp. EYE_5]|uniref:hypothetical protein n=1 Tax=unclassified Microbacterium TaxID=2609290 RepID=UPI0020041E08|nr:MULTISPECIES: hypothetical protein [unclassified Microbacterium]MCK6080878.1 hypothetical protein [Microbacterium sp. EYE_382]MCK6086149.1 hypothetical protein [Microbacterium sp. EYE_384]MCK6124353.1 hypothetical protein [Microbacterium sp. EYE_80]MCK6127262.1 hypothetical protein [Microbacterium sp. EYE_79]MCK6141833.1 hypothetical protein [Microbacterium sp. EYE_39]